MSLTPSNKTRFNLLADIPTLLLLKSFDDTFKMRPSRTNTSTMKIYLSTLLTIFLFTNLSGQANLSEDFESYNDGDMITIASDDWKIWTGGTDTPVTSERAASGKKSLKLVGGKKTDVYFPFNKRFTAGSLQFSMDLFIPEGSNGYFSFQGVEQVGIVWSMQCYLDNNSFFRMVDDTQVQLQNMYPQDQWFNISVDVNFESHLWRFYIDGECVGSYIQENETRQSIASLALYPEGEKALFYVDNIVLNHVGKAKAMNMAYDASISGVVDPNRSLGHNSLSNFVGLNGEERNFGCRVTNMGEKKIKNFELTLQTATETSSQKFNIDLSIGADTMVVLEKGLVLDGEQSATISITKINGKEDENTCNNSFPIQLKGYDLHPDKKVWVEEATGTWCGWCPRGDVYMNYLSEKYPDHFVGIAVHQNDPMELPTWMGTVGGRGRSKKPQPSSGLGNYIQGFPSAVIERTETMDPLELELAFLEHVSQAPQATISHSARWDEKSRELELTITTKSLSSISDEVKLIVGLTEDKVHGEGNTWAQSNYYSGGARGQMSGYELKPSKIPGDEMVYNHVAKMLVTDFGGEELEFNGSKNESIVVKTFTQKIPKDWNIENMHIVSGITIGSEVVHNANKSSIADALK